MYALPGYEPLSELWVCFEQRFGALCQEKAIEFYQNPDGYSQTEIFGSPRDLCEDLFLKSLDGFKIALVGVGGEIIEFLPVFSNSLARLFEKATPFESLIISSFPNEAGPEGEWLIRMGSRQFRPSMHSDSDVADWLNAIPIECKNGSHRLTSNACVFHTWPYLFVREAFTVPRAFPPWASDMLEDAYFETLKGQNGDRSMCLRSELADKWRRSLTQREVRSLLAQCASMFAQPEMDKVGSSGGRPNKLKLVEQAMVELGLASKRHSVREIVRQVSDHLNDNVSESTVKRARKELKQSDD